MHAEPDQAAIATSDAEQAAPHEICKISVSIRGHRTSFSVERAFFEELSALAARQGISLARLVSGIDHARHADQNLSSAIRLYILNALKADAAANNHH